MPTAPPCCIRCWRRTVGASAVATFSRRLEASGYAIDRVVDLTGLETRGEYLEGTGSLVLDRARHVAYACLSPRTCGPALAEFARQLRYDVVPFTAVDGAGRAIYHTNVVLSLGTRFAALCTAAIADSDGASRRRRAPRSIAARDHRPLE